MSESYMVPWTDTFKVGNYTWAAQTFTPHQDHSPLYIAIKCFAYLSEDEFVYVQLHTTSAGKPTGTILAFAKLNFRDFPSTPTGKTVMVTLKPLVNLVNGTQYAIVIREGYIRIGFYFGWRYVKNTATYAFGEKLTSNNAGQTWTPQPNDDFCFSEWGYPPGPPTPPPPPLNHFAVLDLVQELTMTGYKITAATNVPCHLYMAWTDREPLKHRRAMLRRGELWKDAIRFCFVGWHLNEQEEEGDTIYHTFIKEPWPGCETRWFAFRATIDGVWSPSVTAIFKKHRTTFGFVLLLLEPWTVDYEPPDFELIILEPWEGEFPIPHELILAEPWSLLPILPPGTFIFWEPWGTYLREYNNWRYLNPPPEVGITFENGIIKLTSPGDVDIGIAFYPEPDYPLKDTSGHPLSVIMDNPDAQANDHTSAIALAGYFTHPTERTLYFQLLIAYGTDTEAVCPFGTAVAWNHDWVWLCLGLGQKDIDLFDLWERARIDLGKGTDPTDWLLKDFHFGLHNAAPAVEDWLKNDYIGFYYPAWDILINEPWTVSYEPPDFESVIMEPWTVNYLPPTFQEVIKEPWTS